jgi:isoleucyl-tRNA synthetase
VPKDYKNTMNLPQTEFPMRGGLPASEPLRLEKWRELDVYGRLQERNSQGPAFILHDGPPYANGGLHMGHAFNKTLKDFIIRYRSQRGFRAPYVPGWDCHGQPIEHMVEEKLGPEKMAAISQPDLRRLCHDWATRHIDMQRQGFMRLGVLGEWDAPYLTYSRSYEAGNVEVFKALYESGAVYRGRKPIHWCTHCHTALAEAELEYADEPSPSIYVAFRLSTEHPAFAAAASRAAGPPAAAVPDEGADDAGAGRAGACQPHVLIWTTTPWTLPANAGVSLAPDAEYVALLHADKYLIIARQLLSEVALALGIEGEPQLLTDAEGVAVAVSGADLAELRYAHPIHEGMSCRVVTGPHVELNAGTGAVHTAPGHGHEDYLMGELYGLPMLMPVDGNGVFDEGAGAFAGMGVEEANPRIIEFLRQEGALLASRSIRHSYPHCWRCHNPVIFRATDQWFVSMDATGLRDAASAELDKLAWHPAWAVNRLRSMIESRPDWCISRQRSWGVPIPVFRCKRCSSTVATAATFDAVAELFEKEGADAWFTRQPSEYLPQGTACAACGCADLEPERDILDVWWESGVSHTSVLRKREGLGFPADLYLEGSDQHRGWFQSSLLTSVAAYGTAPYRGIMSCGFVVDGEGNKMSKSLGNGIDPLEVVGKLGADVLRLWVGSIDYAQDVGISDEILERTADAYRRIRNTFRFLLSNLHDFDHVADAVGFGDMGPLDRWAMARLARLVDEATQAYEDYRFHAVFHLAFDYIVTDLSAVYLDALKDRLYSDAAKSQRRRSAQTVLAHVLESLVRLLAPILCFTADEAWDAYPVGMRDADMPPAVALAGWPSIADFAGAPAPEALAAAEAAFAEAIALRDHVTRELEQARAAKLIQKSQEAHVLACLPPSSFASLSAFDTSALAELLIVSSVDLAEDAALQAPAVSVSKAAGEKCPRCWNVTELGSDPRFPEVCGRCAEVLAGIEGFGGK